MAFTTTTGAGGTSLIGTSGVDATTITPSALTTAGVFIQAEGDNDIVNTLGGGSAATNYRVLLGNGNDTLNVASALTTSTVQAGDGTDALTFTGLITSSTVSGLNGVDAITVSAGATSSLINGNNDGDNITVGTGGTVSSSTIAGGQGSDTINLSTVTFASGRVNGQDGDDTINITAALAADMAAGASINGGQGNDIIGATSAFAAGALNLSGDDGNDLLTGGNDNDSIWGGLGADTIVGDFSVASVAADTLVGGDGVDTFRGVSVALTAGTAALGGTASAAGLATATLAALAAGNVFSGGSQGAFDVITDFNAGAGGDKVDVTGSSFSLQNAAIGAGALTATNASTFVYAISGTWASGTGAFTTAATNSAGPDTLILSVTTNFTSGAATTVTYNTDAVVLRGVNASTFAASNLA